MILPTQLFLFVAREVPIKMFEVSSEYVHMTSCGPSVSVVSMLNLIRYVSVYL